MVLGETGTGKEVVAKAIHYNSPRKKAPFVAVNTAAIPSELIESELFGHEKGAFTGAQSRHKGCFERAEGGTLFLDEIGEMELPMQAKLLRVLQERQVYRVGGEAPIDIDVRIIAATHRNLPEMISEGTFREDLYYRLLGLTIELPPLKNRGRDIIQLAEFFLKQTVESYDLPVASISKTAQKKLMDYHYPGNVRELRAEIERAAILTDGEAIQPEDLGLQPLKKREGPKIGAMTLKEHNDQLILELLEHYGGSVQSVAKHLDIGKSTIYRLLKEK
jgi:transcriptional regulator with PAS, ATPase and Fis domain